MPAELDPSVKHDLLYFFDVTDGNPNGDPDAGNRPRTDDETSQGLVTDVSLKRKVRDAIGLAAESTGLGTDRYQIFVQSGHALNTRLEESYASTGLPLGKETKDAGAARGWLCERYVDIRLFGGVLSTGKTPALGQIRGPVQFGMARSIDPVSPVDHAITRVTQTTQADIDKGERTEMGGKWTVPYALYRCAIHYSAPRGKQTGVTGEDLAVFLTTLLNMFEHDRSAARGEMSARGLYVFSHRDGFGAAPAQSLFDRVTVTTVSTSPPRGIDDYKVDVDDTDLPEGVTLTRLLG